MGEIAVTGAGAKEFVHSILTNDVLQAQNGQAVYGILCYENGQKGGRFDCLHNSLTKKFC